MRTVAMLMERAHTPKLNLILHTLTTNYASPFKATLIADAVVCGRLQDSSTSGTLGPLVRIQ